MSLAEASALNGVCCQLRSANGDRLASDIRAIADHATRLAEQETWLGAGSHATGLQEGYSTQSRWRWLPRQLHLQNLRDCDLQLQPQQHNIIGDDV